MLSLSEELLHSDDSLFSPCGLGFDLIFHCERANDGGLTQDSVRFCQRPLFADAQRRRYGTSAAATRAVERENRELRQADEILRKASAYFAQAEPDRRSKTWRRSSTNTGVFTGSS